MGYAAGLRVLDSERPFCPRCGASVAEFGFFCTRCGWQRKPFPYEYARSHREPVAVSVGNGKPSIGARICIATAVAIGNGLVGVARGLERAHRIARWLRKGRR